MRTVLVTGGSSGLGLATARRLAAAGDRVFAASRGAAQASLPGGVTPVTLDVADGESRRAAARAVVEATGRLDVLVNNAGAQVVSPIEETRDEVAEQVFAVNLFGPLRLAREVLPIMRAQGGGRIVNVTSICDILPTPFLGWYSAAKSALASASAVLDAEVHRFGVSVTVVAPGLFQTPMAEATSRSYHVEAGSPYREAVEAFCRWQDASLESAGDPEAFAAAIEACLAAEDPPARVVVGDDAAEMAKMLRESDAEEYARLLRRFVERLPSESAAR